MAGTLKTSQFNSATIANPTDEVPLLQGGQLKRVQVKVLTGNPDVGWQASGEKWTFSSWNATTRRGVIVVPSDATVKYAPMMWVRFSQATGGTKWGRIVSLTSTTLTIAMSTGQTLTNETLSTPVYSPLSAPQGSPSFPFTYTDTNSFSILDFATYKEAYKTTTFEFGAIGGGANAGVGVVTLPTGLTTTYDEIRHVKIAGNSPYFNQVWENNTLYLMNITGGTVDPNTITAQQRLIGA